MMKLILMTALAFGSAAALADDTAKKADSPKAKFVKKCVRNMTKDSCTAPKEARAEGKKSG
jgi:hypothetical protein